MARPLLKPWMHPPFLLALAVGIYFGLDAFIDLPPTGLVFYAETIRAETHGDAVDFVCEFEFHATHPRQTGYTIFFPTHQAGGQAAPENVMITVDGRAVEARVVRDGFSYEMPVTPGGVARKEIRYTIRAPGRRAVYVTKTANLWPRPPAEARFVLPASARSNYHSEGKTEVIFKPFHPSENWAVAW